MSPELLYQLALTLVPNIGPVQARILLQHFNAREVFGARMSLLERIEGIGNVRARAIKKFNAFALAERELRYIEQQQLQALFITGPGYPKRLLHCFDAPVLLYYKGSGDLNASKMVAVVGTRMHTDYGKVMTEQLITELASQQVVIVSGLAYGIDALAHKTALQQQLPTIGVLAHGHDTIYPSYHSSLAREMIGHGGLLTEFMSGTKPDRHHFPARNRIVAGLCDATVVVETDIRGGSMITAELADGYNRDVFAFPGKTTDKKSAGCNHLVRTNKAMMLTCAADLIQTLGWAQPAPATPRRPRELFIDLSPEEKIIVELLREKSLVHVDEISMKSALPMSAMAAAILNLEMQGIINSRPGKLYSLCN